MSGKGHLRFGAKMSAERDCSGSSSDRARAEYGSVQWMIWRSLPDHDGACAIGYPFAQPHPYASGVPEHQAMRTSPQANGSRGSKCLAGLFIINLIRRRGYGSWPSSYHPEGKFILAKYHIPNANMTGDSQHICKSMRHCSSYT